MPDKDREKEQKKLREEVSKEKDELLRTDRPTTRQLAPFLDHMQQTTSSGDQLVLPSGGERRNLYSDFNIKEENKIYKLTLTPKCESLTREQIKAQLKRNSNSH